MREPSVTATDGVSRCCDTPGRPWRGSLEISPRFSGSFARGVGHEEQSLADMLCADFARSEDSNRNAETHSLQSRDKGSKLSVRIPCDVLAEETNRPALFDDAKDLIDEEPFVCRAEPFARDRIGLAWITGSDEMNAVTPRLAVEGGKVIPDRRRIQFARFHARDKERGCISFPLHVSDGTMSRFSDRHAKSEP